MEKTVIMFSGQGAQHVGMGKKIYERYDVVKKLYSLSSDVLNLDFKNLCFNSDVQELTKTKNAQLATFVMSYAVYQAYLQKFEIVPFALCGHSLGEITALTVSNVIRFVDALKIIEKRGDLMSDFSKVKKGRMLAVHNMSVELIQDLCDSIKKEEKFITIANYNSNNQIILSGEDTAIEVAIQKLKGKSIIPLKVSGAFHSMLMEPITNDFYDYLNNFNYFSPMIPVISSVDGNLHDDVTKIPEHLKKQLTGSVLWIKVMEKIKELKVSKVIEIGPKEVLLKFAKDNIPEIDSFFAEEILLK